MAARTTRSAATERAYLHFAPAPARAGAVVVVPTSPAAAVGGAGDEDFDESDIWGALAPLSDVAPAADPPRARQQLLPSPTKGNKKPAAHGSLPVMIPDWSKILGSEYRPAYHHHDWEVDDDEDSVDAALVPPHELAMLRRRATSLSLKNGVVGRTLKVRDAVWKRTGFL